MRTALKPHGFILYGFIHITLFSSLLSGEPLPSPLSLRGRCKRCFPPRVHCAENRKQKCVALGLSLVSPLTLSQLSKGIRYRRNSPQTHGWRIQPTSSPRWDDARDAGCAVRCRFGAARAEAHGTSPGARYSLLAAHCVAVVSGTALSLRVCVGCV